ncbi:hypothetical protein DFH27DRAFT_520371 [Peziza echinospora]|nr:hypothetical protein DFH27DRAFT_520371 [Peziza echinospora]
MYSDYMQVSSKKKSTLNFRVIAFPSNSNEPMSSSLRKVNSLLSQNRSVRLYKSLIPMPFVRFLGFKIAAAAAAAGANPDPPQPVPNENILQELHRLLDQQAAAAVAWRAALAAERAELIGGDEALGTRVDKEAAARTAADDDKRRQRIAADDDKRQQRIAADDEEQRQPRIAADDEQRQQRIAADDDKRKHWIAGQDKGIIAAEALGCRQAYKESRRWHRRRFRGHLDLCFPEGTDYIDLADFLQSSDIDSEIGAMEDSFPSLDKAHGYSTLFNCVAISHQAILNQLERAQASWTIILMGASGCRKTTLAKAIRDYISHRYPNASHAVVEVGTDGKEVPAGTDLDERFFKRQLHQNFSPGSAQGGGVSR